MKTFIKNNGVKDAIKKRGRFTIVHNEIFEQDISVHAKVLWCYILSKPENWRTSRNQIAKILKFSKDKVSDILVELQELNMISVERMGKSICIETVWSDHWACSASQEDSECLEDEDEASDELEDGLELEPKPDPGRVRTKNGPDPRQVRFDAKSDPRQVHNKEDNKTERGSGGDLEKQRPSVDTIRRSWEASFLSENQLPPQQSRLPLLRELMATLRKHGYTPGDLGKSFEEKVTSHWWAKAKDKTKREAMRSNSSRDYDLALLEMEEPIALEQPRNTPPAPRVNPYRARPVGKDGPDEPGMSVDTLLNLMEATEQDELDILARYEEILSRDDEEDVL